MAVTLGTRQNPVGDTISTHINLLLILSLILRAGTRIFRRIFFYSNGHICDVEQIKKELGRDLSAARYWPRL